MHWQAISAPHGLFTPMTRLPRKTLLTAEARRCTKRVLFETHMIANLNNHAE
jgi:hypothetical protein